MEKLLLRPSETFTSLGLSRSEGYRRLASGEIPHIRIGKLIRVPVDALREWIERRMSAKEVGSDEG